MLTKSIFITGITGLLGTNLVFDLLKNNYKVKALIRSKKNVQLIAHPNLFLLEGDLFDNIDKHLENIDIFIHIAAETKQNLLNYNDYKKVNFNATKNLFQASVKANIKKFIFISTANTIGYGTNNKLGNEFKPIRTPFTNSMYAKSKLETENFLLSNSDKIEIVILNPTFMIGAYDSKPSSGKIILHGWKKRIIFYPPGGKNFVNVKDVSQGIINSFNLGKSGEKYLLANENLSYKAFYEHLNIITNQNPIMIKIPKSFLLFVGYFGNILRKIGIKTSLSLTNMKALCINNYYCNEKSKHELKINYHQIELGIKDAVHYFEKTKIKTQTTCCY